MLEKDSSLKFMQVNEHKRAMGRAIKMKGDGVQRLVAEEMGEP